MQNQTILLCYNTDNQDNIELANMYWQFLPDSQESFAYKVADIADLAGGMKTHKLLERINSAATAYYQDLTCIDCGMPAAVTSRADYQLKKGYLHQPKCEVCKESHVEEVMEKAPAEE